MCVLKLTECFASSKLQLDAHQNYGKRSDNKRPGSFGGGGGGFGPGGPGGPGGPSGRGPRRGGLDNVRGIDHSMFQNLKLCSDKLRLEFFKKLVTNEVNTLFMGDTSAIIVNVCEPYVVTLLNRTPTFEWYLARFSS